MHCRLITQQSQILELKSTVESLSKEIMSLKSATACINQPQKTRSSKKEFSNQNTHPCTQSISAASQSSNVTSQDKVSTAMKKTINSEITTQEDRKFNVVVYGIQECAKRPQRMRLNHDLDKIKSIITEGENSVSPLSIRDLSRLGKYNENSKNPCPILVKLN